MLTSNRLSAASRPISRGTATSPFWPSCRENTSALARRSEPRLTNSAVSAVKRQISGEITTKRLRVSCTATREPMAKRRRPRRTLRSVSCVKADTPAGIVVNALSLSCSDGVSETKKELRGAHRQHSQLRKLGDIVRNGNQALTVQLQQSQGVRQA